MAISSHKKTLSWADYFDLVLQLKDQISTKPDVIIAIGKGGLIPGVILTEHFENSCTLLNYGVRSYEGFNRNNIIEYQPIENIELLRDKDVLVVDDIADTGQTFQYVVNTFKEKIQKDVATSSIFYKSKSSFTPTHFVKEVPNDVWIVHPWEK